MLIKEIIFDSKIKKNIKFKKRIFFIKFNVPKQFHNIFRIFKII